MNVATDGGLRDSFTTLPHNLGFSIYVFNVTNKEEVIQGSKPRLEEIGPYYFE